MSTPAQDEEARGVFIAVQEAAQAYVDVAKENLRRLSAARSEVLLQKFDTPRMAAALLRQNDGEASHYILYGADASRKMNPVSLGLLWGIHSQTIFVNLYVERQVPAEQIDVTQERCRAILTNSYLLIEVFAYMERVRRAGLGELVTQLLFSERPWSELSALPALQPLLALARQHEENVQNIADDLRAAYPECKAVAMQLSGFAPVLLPAWTSMKDHPGMRIINEVWLPQKYAEPMMKQMAAQQAESTVDSIRRNREGSN